MKTVCFHFTHTKNYALNAKNLSSHEEFLGPAVSTNLPVGASFLYENSNISKSLLSEEDFFAIRELEWIVDPSQEWIGS